MQSIKEIRKILEHCRMEDLPEQMQPFAADSRKGVQKLLASFRKKYEQHERELARLESLLTYERACYAKGFSLVAGVDEVGRGPLAGPVVAAAVILPQGCKIEGVNDSKKLSAKKREALYDVILEQAIAYGIGVVSNARIDEINILQATYEAMRQALEKLEPQPEFILADAVTIPQITVPQEGIVQGDAKSLSIGAASIVAKVYRDRMMAEYDTVYPGYGFAANKGYGAREHLEGIRRQGITPLHRRSFLRNILPQAGENPTEKGNRGELLAAKEMQRLGYEILERNYRIAEGEIDIIARKNGFIVFTEVKYRRNMDKGMPAEAVDKRKQGHIMQAAQAYLAAHGWEECSCRFDVAEVLTEGGRVYFRYTEDAFRA